jgi:hypothetical protein
MNRFEKMTGLIGKDYVGINSIIARNIVRKFILEHLDKADPPVDFDVYIVWQCYILGNRKWLISSSLPDKMYYEVTYDANKRQWYLDSYVKLHNVCIADENIKMYFREFREGEE